MKVVLSSKPIEVSEQEYQALLRNEFYPFVERSFCELNAQTKFLSNWHVEKIAQELEECRLGRTKRLIINVPPRSLKSHCASVAFPAWLLGHNPSLQIISVCYGQDLANTLASQCRTLMASAWYQNLFPTRLATKKQSINDFYTMQNGVRMATSVGGVLTGRGADFLIIDDPLKPEEAVSESQRRAVNDWYDHTLITRLNNKRDGCIIIIMQRLHEDDLVGHVREIGDWKVLRFPAIAEEDETHVIRALGKARTITRKAGEALHPDREPIEVLNALRELQGEYNFAGQYQQTPAPLGGGMVKREWLRTYTPATLPDKFELVFQSWDSANKSTELSDYSVCTTWGLKQHKFYLLDVLRRRMDYPELKKAVKERAAVYKPKNIIIEDKASGTQLIQELVREGVRGISRYTPKLDKQMRMHSVTSTIENGLVYLPERAPWLDVYLLELLTFPRAKFSDQADSTSQALDWAKAGASEPGIVTYWRLQTRKDLLRKGRLDEVREMDEKYGAPDEELVEKLNKK